MLGQYLYAWFEQVVGEMQKSGEAEGGQRLSVADLGQLLELSYFVPGSTRSDVAQAMKLSETTYYRWLRRAWVHLTTRLRDKTAALQRPVSQEELA